MRLLIVGTGRMANGQAKAFADIPQAQVVAAVDRDADKLRLFCQKHGIDRPFTDLADALAWNGFDAATVVTDDTNHMPCCLPLLAAGKHVLCEKPLAPNVPDAEAMVAAADAAGVVAMTNLTFRGNNALCKARAMVRAGAVGTVKHVEASLLQNWLTTDTRGDWRTDPAWLWKLSRKHGSQGALGDVGIYLLDFPQFAGLEIAELQCRLQTFDKAPGNRIGEYELDANDSATLNVRFDNGALGILHTSRFATGHHNAVRLRIYGELGALVVNSDARTGTLSACVGDDLRSCTWRPVDAPPVQNVFERFVDAVLADGEREPSFRAAAHLQRLLAKAFASAKTA